MRLQIKGTGPEIQDNHTWIHTHMCLFHSLSLAQSSTWGMMKREPEERKSLHKGKEGIIRWVLLHRWVKPFKAGSKTGSTWSNFNFAGAEDDYPHQGCRISLPFGCKAEHYGFWLALRAYEQMGFSFHFDLMSHIYVFFGVRYESIAQHSVVSKETSQYATQNEVTKCLYRSTMRDSVGNSPGVN